MTVKTCETSAPKNTDHEPLKHIFPATNPDSGRIGERAYCGALRDRPWSGAYWVGGSSSDTCIVCIELVAAGRGR